MNREQLRNTAWLAMNDFTELAGFPDAKSNRDFHQFSAATEDDWPTLAHKGLIVDILPGDKDNEILVQTTDPEHGECHEELCCAETQIDLFFLVFNSLRCAKKFID